MIHIKYDGCRTSYRYISENDWSRGLYIAYAMMIDDAHNLCLVEAVYALALLVMIHQHQLFLLETDEITL